MTLLILMTSRHAGLLISCYLLAWPIPRLMFKKDYKKNIKSARIEHKEDIFGNI